MASSLKAKFEAEAEAQRAASTPPSKPEPTGVKALMKKHKEFVNPPPPKVSWNASHQGQAGPSETSHVKYERQGGVPKGPPPKKSLTDLP